MPLSQPTKTPRHNIYHKTCLVYISSWNRTQDGFCDILMQRQLSEKIGRSIQSEILGDILFFYYHIIIEQKTILNPLEKPLFSVIKKVKTKLLNRGF